MPLSLAYWILMLLYVCFACWNGYRSSDGWIIGGGVIGFLLFLVIGLKLFGAPLHGG